MSGGLNRRQAFAAHAAAVGKRGLAAFARITVEKSVLPLAAHFLWLILAFHKLIRRPSGGRAGVCEDTHETPCVKAGLASLHVQFALDAELLDALAQGRARDA
jgi:hypothetical protein